MKSILILLCISLCAIGAAAQDLQYLSSAFWAQAFGVEVAGHYAYCAYLNGLVIFDVSDLQNPVPISRVYTEGSSLDVDIAGDYAFLADYRAGLKIINIADPYNPYVEACYETDGRVVTVHVVDEFAYLADGPGGENGLVILDVSNPSAPQFVANCAISGACEEMWIEGDYAYMAGLYGGLMIVDIADPYHPTAAAFYAGCSSSQVYVSGNTGYMTGSYGGADGRPEEDSVLHIFDVTDPTNPFPIAEYEFTGWAQGAVLVSGDYAYVKDQDLEDGMYISVIDISDPTLPTLAGSVRTDGVMQDLTIIDDVLYAAMGVGGFQTLDLSVAAVPAMMGQWWEAFSPCGLAVVGNTIYMGDNRAGLRVLDISNPLAPVSIASLSLPGAQGLIQVQGDYAYSLDYSDCVNIIDISDPHHPDLLTRIEEEARAVAIVDDLAFLAEQDGLLIYDISDPPNPSQVGQCSIPGHSWDVRISGDFAYIAALEEGLQIVDISDPTNPTLRGGISIDHEYFMELTIVDAYAYVPTSHQGLAIFDVSDPDDPTHTASFPLSCRRDLMRVVGNQLFVGTYAPEGNCGVTLLDIADREAPVILDDYCMPGSCEDLYSAGEHIYLVNRGSLMILGYQTAAAEEPRLTGQESPLTFSVTHPAPGTADIRFAAPDSDPLRIEVIDVSGRQRATLLDGVVGQGEGFLHWNWSAAGLASGSYFTRIHVDDQVAVRPITLIR